MKIKVKRPKQRKHMPPPTKAFKDKSKYSRKIKHPENYGK